MTSIEKNGEFWDIPLSTTAKELQGHMKALYIINDYMASEIDYRIFQERIYNLIKGCIEHKECREHKVRFKFYVTDKETHELELRHFVVNVFLWFPLIDLYGIKVLNKKFIMDCKTQTTNGKFSKYVNKVIISTLQDYNVRQTKINYKVSEALYSVRRISIDFSLILGLSMSAMTFIDMYKKYPRMQQIITTQFSNDMQPSDVEDELDALMKEVIQIFKDDNSNAVGVILNAGTGIKEKQLVEFIVNGGFKPSLDGKTIPMVINSNTMVGGLNKVSSLYIDATGARKSLIMNKKVMGKYIPLYMVTCIEQLF